jgi:trehalose 6-phosphate phosphatase
VTFSGSASGCELFSGSEAYIVGGLGFRDRGHPISLIKQEFGLSRSDASAEIEARRSHVTVMPSRPWALFLDVDGTLLDISETPDGVMVPPGLTPNLVTIWQALGGALAFVTGRSIADIDRLFSPVRLPAAGQHGSEIRFAPDDAVIDMPTAPISAPLRHAVALVARDYPGVELEDKGMTLAVHYRQVPEWERFLSQRLQDIVNAAGHGIILTRGRKVLELRDMRHSKATAVQAFMRQPPFTDRVPVFIGDDITDEDGFQAVEQFGGNALAVGDVHRARRQTVFATPADVRAWLNDVSRMFQGGVDACRT